MTETTNNSINFDRQQSVADKFEVRAAILVISIMSGLSFFYWFTLTDGMPDKRQHLGQFGDLLGGVLNPIISLLTLTVATRVWQLQRRELEATKKALAQQIEALRVANAQADQERYGKLVLDLLAQGENSLHSLVTTAKELSSLALIGNTINKMLLDSKFHSGFGFHTQDKQDQEKIDQTVRVCAGHFEHWLRIQQNVLSITHKKIEDRNLWRDLVTSNLGRDRITLLCMISCASDYSELRNMISSLNIHRELSLQYRENAIHQGWFPVTTPD